MNHTPSPWTLGKGSMTIRQEGITGSKSFIARTHIPGNWRYRSEEEQKANAILIAAAPELLEQCIILCDAISQFAAGDRWPELDDAYAAIAKAKGQ